MAAKVKAPGGRYSVQARIAPAKLAQLRGRLEIEWRPPAQAAAPALMRKVPSPDRTDPADWRSK